MKQRELKKEQEEALKEALEKERFKVKAHNFNYYY